jgi:transcriptional regulator with XRE-family HTH domain
MIIRKLRLDRGYSQEDLAAMSDVSVRTIQRIERGGAANPETLKSLAAALDVDFGDLRKEQPMPASPTPHLPELSRDEREAMEYVRDIQSFYIHLGQYCAVMVLLVGINLWTSPGFFWAVFPAIGWGIGVAVHGLSVFEVINLFGRDWEKRQIEKRMRR